MVSIGNEWTVTKNGDKVQLKSWKGDYLHRPDTLKRVTTWYQNGAIGNYWTVIKIRGKIMLKSWKHDYLHRPNSKQGVTTHPSGVGNFWTLERV